MTELLRDGSPEWSLGQDAWHRPDLIQQNQYAAGVNVCNRGGSLKPRSGWWQQELVFEGDPIESDYGYSRSLREIWESGKFQAAIPYYQEPNYYALVVIAGLIFRVNVDSKKVVLLSRDIRLGQYQPRVNWSYGDAYIILFDWPNYPVFIKGEEVLRSDPNHTRAGFPEPQVPISTLGTYNKNRLFIANAGIEFTAGDPVGSLATPDAPITFTELFAEASPYRDQFFALPTGDTAWPITAMGFLQEVDENTGIGPMFVSSEKDVFFAKTNQPRENWTTAQFAAMLLPGFGVVGPRAFVNRGSDLIFVDSEGDVSSFSVARSQAQKWGNVPISREVNNWITWREQSLLQFTVVGAFDNRIFISVNPYRVQALDRSARPISDYAFGGFVVLDVESMSSLLTQSTPVWSGLWTGINPMEIFTLGGRCFVISKDGIGKQGVNALYEMMPDVHHDIVRGHVRQVRSIIETKNYDFQRPDEQKREHSVMLHIQDLAGHVSIKCERKPSHATEWTEWGTFIHEAPYRSTEVDSARLLNGTAKHQLKEVIFGDPVVEGCSELTDEFYHTASSLQLRLTIEAEDFLLEDLRILSQLVPHEDVPTCAEDIKEIAVPAQPEPYWLIPETRRAA